MEDKNEEAVDNMFAGAKRQKWDPGMLADILQNPMVVQAFGVALGIAALQQEVAMLRAEISAFKGNTQQ